MHNICYMDNHIFILGAIGDSEGDVSLNDVKSQYNPKADKVFVHISSDGGHVDVGMSMRDFLMGIPQDVHTIGEGMVASIATMPFLAGNTRELKPNCQFLGHLPSIDNFSGNADDFERASNYMSGVKSEIAKIYSNYSNQSVDDMVEFMRKDTPIWANAAKDMGFATFVPEFKAVAKINRTNINNEMSEVKEKTKLDEISDKLLASITDIFNASSPETVVDMVEEEEKPEVENMNIELEDGSIIFVDSEDGEVVGKMAYTTDEEGNKTEDFAPEGTHVLKDGRSIVVGADGIVVSVSEVENKDEEKEALTNEIAELKAQLEASNSANEKVTNEFQDVQNKLITEIESIKKQTLGKTVVAKAFVKPVDKLNNNTKVNGHKMDAFANSINNK